MGSPGPRCPAQQRGLWPTYRVAIGNTEHSDHLAGITHGEEGAIMGVGHVCHRALGLQELALVLQRVAQDRVHTDIAILQVWTEEGSLPDVQEIPLLKGRGRP